MQANDRKTYCFRGAEEEIVPSDICKVVVDPSVQELPWHFRNRLHRGVKEVVLHQGLKAIGKDAFRKCSLQRISIYTTTQVVSTRAFEMANALEEVEFVDPSNKCTSDELTVIEEEAFVDCSSLQRITIPPTVKIMGKHVFADCSSLVEANLSKSRMKMISPCTFEGCSSLQAICLPKSVECIGHFAFRNCFSLVTVQIPAVEALVIQARAFSNCASLINVCLPENHSSDETSFHGCTLLEELIDEELDDFDEMQSISSWSCSITAGLVNRLCLLPIHNLCYQPSTVTAEEFLRSVNKQTRRDLIATDIFLMTPFHVLWSSVDPRPDLFEILLDTYPCQVLSWKDANGKRATEYLLANWTKQTTEMLLATGKKWMLDPLSRWGTKSRRASMTHRVQHVVNSDNKESRSTLWNEACNVFEIYETLECVSLLEMALWKTQFKSACWKNDNDRSKKMALDRHQCLLQCGSGVILPHVGAFLGLKFAPSQPPLAARLWDKL